MPCLPAHPEVGRSSPRSAGRRTNYLFELLRKNYAPKLDPAGVPDQLVEYVSEVAGGVPLQIEEVVHALIKQKKVRISPYLPFHDLP